MKKSREMILDTLLETNIPVETAKSTSPSKRSLLQIPAACFYDPRPN